MRWHRKSSLLLGLALLVLGIQGTLLIQKILIDSPAMTRYGMKRSGKYVAEILEKGAQVRARPAGSLTWYEMSVEEKIFPRDTLVVGPNSWAKVRFQSGEIVKLEAESLISFPALGASDRDTSFLFEVKQGNIEVDSTSSPLSISVKGKAVSLNPNSKVTLQVTPRSQSDRVNVKKGSAVLVSTSKTSPLSLLEGESLRLTEVDSSKIEKIEIKTSPPAAETKEAPPLDSVRQPPPEKKRLEPKRKTASKKATPTRKRATEEVKKQSVYALAEDQSQKSQKSALLRAPANTNAQLNPNADSAGAKNLSIHFDWDDVAAATTYVIQIATSPKFITTTLEFEADRSETELTLVLEEGETYFWHVGARDVYGNVGKWSQPKQIDLKQP